MKKSYIPISDVSNEKNELTRRIYRSLTEVVRQLDDVRGRSQTVSNLFLPCSATLKIKLHDLCYKLIMADPLGYGKKGEELLWRKGYHDMFTTAKRLRKNDTWSPEEAGFVQGLLISGIGHYQHLLFKLQTDYKLNFLGIMDFPLSMCDLGLPKGKSSPQQKPQDKNLVEWAKESCHRCLIYLGDLNRYLLDVYPLWDSGTAERYYLQAANMDLNCGRPYNQLGTLAGCKNYNLDAVYNYVRCLIRPEPFQGVEGNLKKTLDKNSEFVQLEPFLPNPAPVIQKLIMRFLFLFDIWYFEKSIGGDLHNSCHEMLQDFQFCLREENMNCLLIDYNELEIFNLTPFRDRSLVHPDRLDSDMVLKMIILVLLCVDKLQKKDSPQTSAAVAMCLAMFSQLLQQVIERFQHFYSRYGPPEVFSNESQKSQSSSCESQSRPLRTEKYKKRNKFERFENQTNGNTNKRNAKYSEKKRNKCIYPSKDQENCNVELSDTTTNDIQETKKIEKKKSRLKRRKRVRPVSSCESDLSDSDITLNDSSTDDESFSGDSESDEVISSGSEDLDETLLIIDQKIKEKKNKEEEKGNQVNGFCTSENNSSTDESKKPEEENSVKNMTEVSVLDVDITKNGVADRNGIKLSNEKDKTKSLFTIHNGVEEDVKLNENNKGDFNNEESTIGSDTPNGNTQSESATNESSELGETVKEVDSNTTLFNLRQVDTKKFIQFLLQQGILKAIKVYCDWFQTDPETVKACSKSSKTLLGKLVTFLNLVSFEEELFSKEWNNVKEVCDVIPLSEDMVTRGLNLMQGSHEKLDWGYHKTNRISNVEESLLRLRRLTEFGHYLTKIEETGILFNKQNNTFYISGQNGKVANMPLELMNKKQTNNASRKGQLMKNMGQLWLKAEVRDLESRVRRRAGNFSPYLVVDSEALIEHIILVKQLVGSRQFIVIIPTVVLSHLDECKRDSGRARETIRWLESQFQHGNRSLRAQKSQERISLPLIKYPKKKDKEAWNFFQIVECCHYFSKQSEFQSCQSNLLVTLLTGQKDASFVGDSKKDDFGKDYSPMGVAKNFGINLEHIETFHTKWKLSTKSHG